MRFERPQRWKGDDEALSRLRAELSVGLLGRSIEKVVVPAWEDDDFDSGGWGLPRRYPLIEIVTDPVLLS
jgi:hypothetical protein